MRALIAAVALSAVCLPALARDRSPHKMREVPSIMVPEHAPKLIRKRHHAIRAVRHRRLRHRTARHAIPVPAVPLRSYGGPIGSTNRAIGQQIQGLQSGQQTQFELNQLRNQIPSAPIGSGSIGCPAGSIGC